VRIRLRTPAEVVALSPFKRTWAELPADAFDINDCIRLGCRERGTCQCAQIKLRPRVRYDVCFFFEFYRQTSTWMLARDRASRNKISKWQRRRILKRDGGRCLRCRSTERLEIDHIVPVARGGSNADDNLQTLCWKCNNGKGATLAEAPNA
jgi:hypothetical protein